jgi:4-hydroxy-2-oxoheptanedioate aldolase
MIVNTTKQKLKQGAAVFGCFVRSPDATFAEFVATGGWDFLVFDGEHGNVSTRDVADLARACEVRGVTPIARVSANNPSAILRCLDAGAAGLHIPWVNSMVEAEAAVRAMKYWPQGQRGLAGNRSIDWTTNLEATAAANSETLSVIHIETAEAAEAVDDSFSSKV